MPIAGWRRQASMTKPVCHLFAETDMDSNAGIRICLLTASSMMLIAVAGCDKPGPAESAGRTVDQTMEKMGRKVEQAADSARDQASKAGQAIDDTTITAAVKAGILAEPGLKVFKIDVDTKDGQVTLTGSADSPENVQRATQIARGVVGVRTVTNRLAVSSKS